MVTTLKQSTYFCLLPIPQQPGGETAQLHHCPCLLTALVAIHPLSSSCTITDGGNNISCTGHHNNRPQHPVHPAPALQHHAPSAGLQEALSAVVNCFTPVPAKPPPPRPRRNLLATVWALHRAKEDGRYENINQRRAFLGFLRAGSSRHGDLH
ncbi:hypothetical protein ATANTOWER_031848 [Ataeniobius toweri]|uniref:Uncharacterized protein n=1 Tax=Ataeniobius toweri TaxID=208326 RepID=A0ABU7C699_9TELE|nr:hypothetical protein [Ataeniobius toweri]